MPINIGMRVNKMARKNYDEFLKEELQDPELAAEYLSASIQAGSIDEFLVALRNVAEARGGISTLSNITELNRQSMYKTLSAEGNPRLSSLMAILKALGINLSFSPQTKEAR